MSRIQKMRPQLLSVWMYNGSSKVNRFMVATG
jgi:hypothetical protein